MAVAVGYDPAIKAVVLLRTERGQAVAQLAVLSRDEARRLIDALTLATFDPGPLTPVVTAEAAEHTQLSIFDAGDHG